MRLHSWRGTTWLTAWPYIGARRLSWACVAPVLWMALVSEHGVGAAGTHFGSIAAAADGHGRGAPAGKY